MRSRPPLSRSLASPLASRPDRRSPARLASHAAIPTTPCPDRRCLKPPSPGSNRAADADVHVAVPPDAAVYAVAPRCHPRAGEPHHAFPGHLSCVGEGAIVRQACRAAAAHCTAVRVARARAAPPAALAGRAGPRRGPPALRRPRPSTGRVRMAVGRARAVHVGRADTARVGQVPLCNWAERGFGPVTLELVFLFSEYIQILTNLKICIGFI
jgi:hypothetical protein